MDDESFSKPQDPAPEIDANSGEIDPALASPKVFDISSDLNILPVTDASAASEAPIPAPEAKPKAPVARTAPVPIPAPVKSGRIDLSGDALKAHIAAMNAGAAPQGQAAPAPKPPMAIPTPSRVIPPPIAAPIPKSAVRPMEPSEKAAPMSAPVELRKPPATAPKIPLQDFSDSLLKAQAMKTMPQMMERAEQAAPAKKQINLLDPSEQPPVPPPAEKTPRQAPVAGSQKALRTYESDVAEVMAQKRTSDATVAIAESKRASGHESIGNAQPSQAPKKLFMLLVSLILIGAGIIGAYYLYSLSPLAATSASQPQAQAPISLIPADAQVALAIDGLSPIEIQDRVRAEMAKPQAPNTIKEIILTEKKNGQAVRVTGPEALGIMDLTPPNMLVRSLTDQWMLAVYADGQGNTSIFVVATDNFFQDAFAGMLQWETVMADDLKQYLYPTTPVFGIADIPASTTVNAITAYNPLNNLNAILPLSATSTASTTGSTASSSQARSSNGSASERSGISTAPAVQKGAAAPTVTSNINSLRAATNTQELVGQTDSIQPDFTLRGQFQDRIIHNKDVREFVTSDGKTLFLYSFIDTTKIFLGANEAGLAEALTRLEQQAFVR